MDYLSTRNNKLRKSFFDILFQGLSNDGGLFLPVNWPKVDINNMNNLTYEEVALHTIQPFVGDDIAEEELKKIIHKTYQTFNHTQIAPLVKIEDNKYILELFYGPTLAFKDYALQFLGNLFSFALERTKKNITIIGATSGDTGSAAINAFKGKSDISVFIMHPHNKVSEVQRRQMTTVTDENIINIAIEGTFDDCQKIIKELFVDREIQSKTSLTAVNSINWARIIAQSVYFFWAYFQLDKSLDLSKLCYIVPSGNFGNIFSARVAKYMGLPINRLHIVTNQNDILHKTLSTGTMSINKVQQTYSPSMDIQISSNFERQIFESTQRDSIRVVNIMNDFQKNRFYKFSKDIQNEMKNIYSSSAVSNDATLEAIKFFSDKYSYLADPHTATGLSVLQQYESDQLFISLACAHPGKFGEAIEKATGKVPTLPEELKNIFDKKEKMIVLPNNFNTIKSLILKHL